MSVVGRPNADSTSSMVMRAALGMDAAPTLASVAVKLKKPTAYRYSAVCLFRWSGLERFFKTLRNTLIANIGVLFPQKASRCLILRVVIPTVSFNRC